MIAGVKISPSEQLSLIIEYTTNESKRLAQRLRNAYIDNPGEGLKEVWCKLGERFDSNSVVTQVHLQEIDSFPTIEMQNSFKSLMNLPISDLSSPSSPPTYKGKNTHLSTKHSKW